MTPSEHHHLVAGHFCELVARVDDWDAPTPVEGWVARDVVDHLVSWSTGFLAAGGVALPHGPAVADDPVSAWRFHVDAVQVLLDAPDADREFTHPYAGTHALSTAIEQFYTADVFMHAWDLARASGQDDHLDEATCAAMLAGMEPIEDLLRSSGQYGPPVPVPDDADVQTRFVAFIGRDPAWRPPR